MDLKGSKTEKNLMQAFSGESEARTKYTYYAGIAKKEGYKEIANIFEEISNNEYAHAKIHFQYLYGQDSTKDNTLDDVPKTGDNNKDYSFLPLLVMLGGLLGLKYKSYRKV